MSINPSHASITPRKRRYTCFIAAPVGTDLDALKFLLKERKIRLLNAQSLDGDISSASRITQTLRRADIVIAILTHDDVDTNVYFELGYAHALNKSILALVDRKVAKLPSLVEGLLYIRTGMDNSEAISFVLDQLLISKRIKDESKKITDKQDSVPQDAMYRSQESRNSSMPPAKQLPAKEGSALGESADQFLAQLTRLQEQGLPENRGRDLEQLIFDVLTATGIQVIEQSKQPSAGIDLAIWFDALDSVIGNPLLIEVKWELRGQGQIGNVLGQVSSYIAKADARWGLVLYAAGLQSEIESQASHLPNLLVMQVGLLLNELRNHRLVEIIRDLRNRKVHGGSL